MIIVKQHPNLQAHTSHEAFMKESMTLKIKICMIFALIKNRFLPVNCCIIILPDLLLLSIVRGVHGLDNRYHLITDHECVNLAIYTTISSHLHPSSSSTILSNLKFKTIRPIAGKCTVSISSVGVRLEGKKCF